MFTKPFRVKSNTQLKSSEKKKLKNDLLKLYPTLSEDELASIVPSKEDLVLMKIETHKKEYATVHLAGKTPIIFHIHDRCYPTLFTLWKAPRILPSFTTWLPVVNKLASGADLMLPGIIIDPALGMKAYGKLPKGETVSIITNENAAPLAVGKTALSGDDMYMSAGKGKGVEILHCIGDHLCQLLGKVTPPELGPPQAVPASKEPENVEQFSETVANEGSRTNERDAIAELSTKATEESSTQVEGEETPIENAFKAEQALEERLNVLNVESEPLKSPQEQMDELLTYSLLKCLKSTAKKADLPILSSTFFKSHILAACPTGETLDVKKSSYKKLSKFLAAMKAEGLLDVKELSPGVESVIAINFAHPKLKEFSDDRPNVADGVETEEIKENDGIVDQPYQAPVIQELYAVNATVAPLFKVGGYSKGDTLTAPKVRKFLSEYVKNNKLQHEEDKNVIKLDAILTSILLNKGEAPDTPALLWESLHSRCLAKMGSAYSLTFTGEQPKLFKGALEPIELSVATRAGNKKVTLVSGLEALSIPLGEFARRCQVGVAASTSLTSTPAKKGTVVLVQGNQISFVAKMLIEEYGIPKKYIKGLELAPKGTKKR